MISKKGIELLTELEGLRLKAYQCSAGVWTIGIGSTYYENGTKVKQGDVITKERAFELFRLTAPKYEKDIPPGLTQNQHDALFCFCYNVGNTAFKNSTLLKVVKSIPNDKEAITNAFLLWKGKDNRLLSRQQKQIKRYFL